MKGKYLYAITKKQDLNPALNKDGLSTLDFDSLSCVIAEAEFKDYQSLAKKEVIKKLTSHQQIIEKIMEDFSGVLPVKFGTILKNDKEVKSVLEKGYSFLQDTLNQMQDKIELDLVCFWNEEKAAQMAYKESKKIRDYYTSEVKSADTSEVERKIALGKLVAEYLAAKRGKISTLILRLLKKEAVESCSHVLADVNILLNQAFLVKKQNEERFNHTLNRLDSEFSDLVNFRLVGPLPPYSFATVVIDVLNKEEIKKAEKLLSLNGELNKEKIKKAYDQLVFKLHPDKGGDPLEFEKTTSAYKFLRKYAEYGLVGIYLYKWENQAEL